VVQAPPQREGLVLGSRRRGRRLAGASAMSSLHAGVRGAARSRFRSEDRLHPG
jgi:hypothetical protein